MEDRSDLPQWLLELVQTLPAQIDRNAGAALVSRYLFPTTKRTVEGWELDWTYPNGRAVAPPISYLAHAHRKAIAAPAQSVVPMHDNAELRLRQIDLLESIRALLFDLEHESKPELLLEQVKTVRLRVDREIEALR